MHDAVQQDSPIDPAQIITQLMPVIEDLNSQAFDTGYIHGTRKARKLKAQATAATWPSRAARQIAGDDRRPPGNRGRDTHGCPAPHHLGGTMNDRTNQAYAALSDLRSLLADMADTTHPIHQPTGWSPTVEQVADAGRLHAAERHDPLTQLARGLKPLGASPAPGDITVMQTRRDIDLDIADLEDAVRERVAPQMRGAATTNGLIGTIIKLLPKIGTVDDLMTHVLAEA
ncbi:hypothetical protein ACIRPH_15925 [Nocardiopsis sp. NPDC101807]|uniref:hypothetical protein n=1 Tax=Nocardiopsis sp. NPDC101807 TaxID=3364339 RepID=UPI00380C1DBD